MNFEQRVTIDAPRQQVWEFVMDVPRVVRCVPGAEDVEALGNDAYRGTLKIRVGPIALALKGDVQITERDEQAGKATMRADAADKRIGGAVKASMHLALDEKSPGSTELLITTDAQVLGKIGEFGQPVIRKKADQILAEFATNLKKELGTPS